MTLIAEQHASRLLREILAPLSVGASIRDCARRRELLLCLERFLPGVLAEPYSDWTRQSLDGIYVAEAHKSGPGEAELLGLCILISDQTLTPIHLRIQASESVDEISWLECRVGEQGPIGWRKTPYKSLSKAMNALERRKDVIDWVFRVTYGERRT